MTGGVLRAAAEYLLYERMNRSYRCACNNKSDNYYPNPRFTPLSLTGDYGFCFPIMAGIYTGCQYFCLFAVNSSVCGGLTRAGGSRLFLRPAENVGTQQWRRSSSRTNGAEQGWSLKQMRATFRPRVVSSPMKFVHVTSLCTGLCSGRSHFSRFSLTEAKPEISRSYMLFSPAEECVLAFVRRLAASPPLEQTR